MLARSGNELGHEPVVHVLLDVAVCRMQPRKVARPSSPAFTVPSGFKHATCAAAPPTFVVSFSIYPSLTLRQECALQRAPARRASKNRKWLTYLTFFFLSGRFQGHRSYTGLTSHRWVSLFCAVRVTTEKSFPCDS